jgi:hypothetical protein
MLDRRHQHCVSCRPSFSRRHGAVCLGLAAILVASAAGRLACADWKDDIDFTKLAALVGPSLEDGTGVAVSQVEANVGDPELGEFIYFPNPNHVQFMGKTLIDGSGLTTAFSGHARNVGLQFYGNDDSIAPGITEVTVFEAVDYLDRMLGFSTGTDPLPQTFRVQNHSWVGDELMPADAVDLLRRFDFVANRDDITMVVGVANGGGAALPQLLGQAYNVISVGRSDGLHSNGPTTLYGAGRVKPEIVAPGGTATSFTTARVSSAVSLLHERANNLGTPDAARSETMKAIVLAGATKDEFPNWSRTTTRPLDSRFGAGELNVFNSYMIMNGGEFDGLLAEPTTGVDVRGWDFGEMITADSPLYYNLEIGAGKELRELSVVLAWNMNIIDLDPTNGFFPSEDLADMSLRLFDSTDGFLAALLDESLSDVDNVEHIYALNLGPGTYTIEVSSDRIGEFGLAWRAVVVPEPGGMTLIAVVAGILALYGQRRRRR